MPQDDSTFSGWAGDSSGTGAAILNMTNDKSVYAIFSTSDTTTYESYVGVASESFVSTNTFQTQDASGDPVLWSPNPQICTDVFSDSYPVTMSVSGSLLESNSFTATITGGPYTEVSTYPGETSIIFGHQTVYPGASSTTIDKVITLSAWPVHWRFFVTTVLVLG